MASLNRVSLIGHLGKDPETRRLASGDPVVSFSIATSESWKDKSSGERKERTEWHNVVIFNTGLCDVAEKYLKKGSKIFVEGQMQTRKWQDQAGADRWSTEVVLRQYGGSVILLDKSEHQAPDPESYGSTRSRDSGSRDSGSSYAAARDGTQQPLQRRTADEIDDDIPF